MRRVTLITWIGRQVLAFFASLGAFALYGAHMARGIFRGRWQWHDFIDHMDRIGVGSLFMVTVTSAFFRVLAPKSKSKAWTVATIFPFS